MTEQTQTFTSHDGIDTWEVRIGSEEFSWSPTLTCDKGCGNSTEISIDADTNEIIFDVQDDYESSSHRLNMPMEAWLTFMEAVNEWRQQRATKSQV